jgi:hypothetical protein
MLELLLVDSRKKVNNTLIVCYLSNYKQFLTTSISPSPDNGTIWANNCPESFGSFNTQIQRQCPSNSPCINGQYAYGSYIYICRREVTLLDRRDYNLSDKIDGVIMSSDTIVTTSSILSNEV